MSIHMNPVLGRELKERVRGVRAFVIATFFVALLALTAFLVYEGNKVSASVFDLGRQTRLGRDLFEWVLFIMTLLVLFFVPGLSAGAVAGERERQTLLPLQVTMLRPRSILSGKVSAAIAYLALLVVTALPVFAVAYLLGGIRVTDILAGVGSILVMALLVAVMVVAISTFAKRVQSATILSYAFTALLVILGPLVYLTMGVLDARNQNDPTDPPAFLLTFNPVVLVADMSADVRTGGSSSPLAAINDGVATAKRENDGQWFAFFPDNQRNAFVFDDGTDPGGVPAWVLSLGSLGALSGVMFVLAARRLRTPAETER